MAKGIMVIDGQRVPFDGERNVLAVIRKAGIDIPSRSCRIEEYAGMVELADAQDLGSCAARRVGSTPTTRIREKAR